MMNYYNPYNQYNGNFNSNEIQNRINQLQQMLGQIQNTQQIPQNNSQFDKGIYVYVKDYQDVVNYPTSADGKATIFIGNGIMWSKKIMDGKNCIQAYSFAPINDTQTNQSTQENFSQPDDIRDSLLDSICERLSFIEEKLSTKESIPLKENSGGKK